MAATTKKIDVAKLAPLIRQLGPNAKKAIVRGALSGALLSVVYMQKRTADEGIFDRGGYRRGWKARATANGAILMNDAPYSPIIEDGRRPGARRPPLPVIERWAKRKLALTSEEAKRASFPIARAIAVRGIKGKHVLRDAVPALVKIVQQEVERELRAEVRKLARR
jgi:hypothetical protein